MTTVLILEDEVGARVALEDQLHDCGQATIAETPAEALQKAKSCALNNEPLDLAIIDLQLPSGGGIDFGGGFKVIEALEDIFPDMPVIVLTIRNDIEGVEKARSFSSIRYYIIKPWNSKDLLRAVRACLKGTAKGFTIIGEVEGESTHANR